MQEVAGLSGIGNWLAVVIGAGKTGSCGVPAVEDESTNVGDEDICSPR
jgi:hypothetical protein